MINVRLDKIKLEDFQNWKLVEIDFNETKNLKANFGYGKTTIYNAFLYALGDSNIKPKPINEKLDIPDNVVSKVELYLNINGEDYHFIRNSNNTFSINDIKFTTLNKYISNVSNIIGFDTNTLNLLIKCGHFNQDTSKWKWNNRREFLINYFGVDLKLQELRSKYDLLEKDFKTKTESEIETSFTTNAKTLNKTKQTLNEMLNDNLQSLSKFSNDREEELKTSIKYYGDLINQVKYSNANEELLKKQQELQDLVETKNAELTKAKDNALTKVSNLSSQIKTNTIKINEYLENQKVLEININKVGKQAQDVLDRNFEPETVCRYCGSAIDPDKIEQNRIAFENARENEFNNLKQQFEKLRVEYNKSVSSYNILSNENDNLEEEKKLLETRLTQEIEELQKKANEEIENKKQELEKIKSKSSYNLNDLQDILLQLSVEMGQYKAKESINENVELLKTKIKNVAEEERLNAVKKQQFIDYVSKSKDIVEKSINENFKENISFKLFNQKSDGSYENECITLLNGKPYDNLSFGEKILADFLLVKYLQKSYDVKLPIFVDNANAFTEIIDNDYQIISLITTINEHPNFVGTRADSFYQRKEVDN